MATMTFPANERRHIPDRRGSLAHSTERTGDAAASMQSGTTRVAGDTMKTSAGKSRIMERFGMASRMNALDWIALALLTLGGLNWGVVGLFETDVVARIFGNMMPISRAIYILVGLSALYSLYTASKMGRKE